MFPDGPSPLSPLLDLASKYPSISWPPPALRTGKTCGSTGRVGEPCAKPCPGGSAGLAPLVPLSATFLFIKDPPLLSDCTNTIRGDPFNTSGLPSALSFSDHAANTWLTLFSSTVMAAVGIE